MSLLVAESFDDLPNSTTQHSLLNRTYNWSGAYISVFSNSGGRAAGRYGGYAKLSGSMGVTNVVWTLPDDYSEIYAAFALYRNYSVATAQSILKFNDGGSNQIELRTKEADTSIIEVYRDGTLLGATASWLPYQTWRWLSVRVVVHESAGVVELRDGSGTVLLSLTGIDTQATAAAQINQVTIAIASNSSTGWDDVLIMDTAGATFNGHQLEKALRTVRPDGDGSTLDWTASAGDRYTAIDDAEYPDEDSTYITADGAGEINLSTLGALTGNETGIEGLILHHRSRRDDVGARTVRGVVRTGGSNFVGETVALEASYQDYLDLWEQNPDTLAAWSTAEVSAIEAGPEVVA